MLSKKALIKVSFTHLLKQDLLLKELRITRLLRLGICIFIESRYVLVYILYTRHYNPAIWIFLPQFWRPFLCFQGGFFHKILSLCMVSIQERFLIKSRLWWHAYGISVKEPNSCIPISLNTLVKQNQYLKPN